MKYLQILKAILCGHLKKEYVNSLILIYLLAINFIVVNSIEIEKEECLCERHFHPVCGSNLQTYNNLCLLECAQSTDLELQLEYNGTCCPLKELCNDFFEPVCDNKGQTHINECIFSYYKCVELKKKKYKLLISSREKCNPINELLKMEVSSSAEDYNKSTPTTTTTESTTTTITEKSSNSWLTSRILKLYRQEKYCNFFCDETHQALCDNNGHTHKNPCKFELANCRLLSRGLPSLTVVHSGDCSQVKSSSTFFKNSLQQLNLKLRSSPTVIRSLCATKDCQKSISEVDESEEIVDELTNTTMASTSTTILISNEDDQNKSLNSQENEQKNLTNTQNSLSSSDLTIIETQLLSENFTECTKWVCDPNLWEPVCDSHNITHKNKCYFEAEVCRIQCNLNQTLETSTTKFSSNEKIATDLRIVHNGQCENKKNGVQRKPLSAANLIQANNNTNIVKIDVSANLFDCTNICNVEQNLTPICDNANRTHQSICLFAMWNCERRQQSQEERILAHIGACHIISPVFNVTEEVCPYKCSKQYKPVCDTNDVTHQNLCAFQMLNCYQRKKNVEFPSWLKSLRACRDKNGSEIPPKQNNYFIQANNALMPSLTSIISLNSNSNENVMLNQNKEIFDTIEECLEVAECEDNLTEENTTEEKFSDIELPIQPTLIEPERVWLRLRHRLNLNKRRQKRRVCDNTGKFHKNECEFARSHCLAAKKGQILRIVDESECLNSTMNIERESSTVTVETTDETEYTSTEYTTTTETTSTNSKLELTSTEISEQNAILNDTIFRDIDCDEVMNSECNFHLDIHNSYCGADFVTYSSFCLFQKAKCRNPELELLFMGNCELCLREPCPLIQVDDLSIDNSHFVCDQNGETKTKCEFAMIRCIYEAKFGYNISISNEGRCSQKNNSNNVTDNEIIQLIENKTTKLNESQSNSENNTSLISHSETHSTRKNSLEIQTTTIIEPLLTNSKLENNNTRNVSKIELNAYDISKENEDNVINKTVKITSTVTVSPSQLTTISSLDEVKLNSTSQAESTKISEIIYKISCSNKYAPVCGTDFITYRNKCYFMLKANNKTTTSSFSTKSLSILHNGECCTPKQCSLEYNPVCDNRNQTHLNFCMFGRERCILSKIMGFNLTIISYDTCAETKKQCKFNCIRPMEYRPICATDGKTYANKEEFEQSVCILKNRYTKYTMPEISSDVRIDYNDECCERILDCEKKQIVCDSRNKTYANKCDFEYESCQMQRRNPSKIDVLYLEKCPNQ